MKTSTQVKIIECVVLDTLNISSETLFEKNRERRIVEPRQIFHYLALKHTLASLSHIGAFNENKYNHATVIHSRKVINDRLDVDKRFKTTIEKMDATIKDRISLAKKTTSTFKTIITNLVTDIFKCENNEDLNDLLKSYQHD